MLFLPLWSLLLNGILSERTPVYLSIYTLSVWTRGCGFSLMDCNPLIFFFITLHGKDWRSYQMLSSVQSFSRVWLFETPWIPAPQASLSISNWESLLKLMSIKSVMAIQPSRLALSPSPPIFNLSHHQGLFQWASSNPSIRASASASVFPMNVQDWFPLGLNYLVSLQPKGFSRVFSIIRAQKYQFFGSQPSLWSNSHIYI